MVKLRFSPSVTPTRVSPGLLRAASVRLAGTQENHSFGLRRIGGHSRVTRITSSMDVTPACTQR